MSDRDIDMLVAQHVMGWKRVELPMGVAFDRGEGQGAWPGIATPRYSSDGAAMLLVVERMRELGWSPAMVDDRYGGAFAGGMSELALGFDPYFFHFFQIGTPLMDFAWGSEEDNARIKDLPGIGIAETMPKACALAALNALGVTPP